MHWPSEQRCRARRCAEDVQGTVEHGGVEAVVLSFSRRPTSPTHRRGGYCMGCCTPGRLQGIHRGRHNGACSPTIRQLGGRSGELVPSRSRSDGGFRRRHERYPPPSVFRRRIDPSWPRGSPRRDHVPALVAGGGGRHGVWGGKYAGMVSHDHSSPDRACRCPVCGVGSAVSLRGWKIFVVSTSGERSDKRERIERQGTCWARAGPENRRRASWVSVTTFLCHPRCSRRGRPQPSSVCRCRCLADVQMRYPDFRRAVTRLSVAASGSVAVCHLHRGDW